MEVKPFKVYFFKVEKENERFYFSQNDFDGWKEINFRMYGCYFRCFISPFKIDEMPSFKNKDDLIKWLYTIPDRHYVLIGRDSL